MDRNGQPKGMRIPSRTSLVMTAVTMVATLSPADVTYLPRDTTPAPAVPAQKATSVAVPGGLFRPLSPPPAAGAR